jgi:hypothetical protein
MKQKLDRGGQADGARSIAGRTQDSRGTKRTGGPGTMSRKSK